MKYPLASRDEWHADCDYAARDGRIVHMAPSEFLEAVRPLVLDPVSRENIDCLKFHMLSGGVLDPLVIYVDRTEDGRHRAQAARELGIAEVPVIMFGN